MSPPRNRLARQPRTCAAARRAIAPWLPLFLVANGLSAAACPFCPSVGPTWCQLRDTSDVALWGEPTEIDATFAVRVRYIWRGAAHCADRGLVRLPKTAQEVHSGLVMLFGRLPTRPTAEAARETASDPAADAPIEWNVVAVDETALGYLHRAPNGSLPTRARLSYFARHLEHANPAIAADAIAEFAAAPVAEVRAVATVVPAERLCAWLADSAVREERKGLYALLLGLAHQAAARQENLAALTAAVHAEASDFRRGFSGILAGYLLAAGHEALADLDARYFRRRDAPAGDVFHALAALRFYHDEGPRALRPALNETLSRLLSRPEFAAEAIVDLARWHARESLEQVVACYAAQGYPQPRTRRAVVGYLQAMADPPALAALEALRRADSEGVREAEEHLARLARPE